MRLRKTRRLRFVAHALKAIPRISGMRYGSSAYSTHLTESVAAVASRMNSTRSP